jgi:outer membrane protein assembly complex protein YaeT
LRFRPVYLALVLLAVLNSYAIGQQSAESVSHSGPDCCPAGAPGSREIAVEQAQDREPSTPSSPAPATGTSILSANGLNSLQGTRVAEIRVVTHQTERPDWLQSLIVQKANEPLDKYKVRRSVQALYDTGRFAEIQVEAERNQQGNVVLIFDAKENFFFGSILVEGAPAPPGDNQLTNASKLNLGEQYTEEKITAATTAMQRLLEENGYYQSRILPFYEWDPEQQQVKVLFVVTKGPRARVGRINVTGSPGMAAGEVMRSAGLEPGDHVSAADVRRALQRLRKKYQKRDRIEAQIALTQRIYHRENNTVDYTFDIVRGPVVQVKVEGASLRQGIIKKYVPIYQENAVDDDLLNEGARNLRNYFQTKGYFDATVAYKEKVESQDRQDVLFDVNRGERHKVVDVVIEGNKFFPRETIRERMQIEKAGGFQLHGLYSQSMLSHDVSAIEALYQANGFLQVKVTPTVEDDYEGKIGHIKVTIKIDEGAQTLVGKVTIEGNHAVPTQTILDLMSSTEGQPYSDTNIASDQTEITNYYFNRGFPDVRFESTVKPEPDHAERMDLTYKITEGSQVFVDHVLISGLQYTKGHIVNREIGVRPGDPLSQDEMLQSQQRLYDLGIFNAVEMAVQNPEGDATQKNVVFQITEARRYTFTYGVGFEVQSGNSAGVSNPQGEAGASARVSFDVTRLNFRGRDQTLTLQTRYGNLQKRVLVGYESPRWFDLKNFTFNLTAFYDDTFDVRTFEARRLEGSAEVKQRASRASTLLYRMIYRRVSIPSNTLVIDPNLIPLFSQPVRVGMPAFTYLRDTRDDPTDSHKGAFSTLDTGLASSKVGSQANFGRLLLQNSTYYQFHKKRWVFARSTRVGVENTYGSTNFIPLPERFFAGGSNSHRGFGLNQAGPRDLQTGFPLGGEALFLNNLELRTPPLPLPFVGNDVSAVVFHDMGNVFSTPTDMVDSFFKYAQPNRSSCQNVVAPNCNFNYMVHAIGSGIRYRTPIGPISFDLGYSLNPPTFPIAQQSRFENLGHFNFYFSIGQTF